MKSRLAIVLLMLIATACTGQTASTEEAAVPASATPAPIVFTSTAEPSATTLPPSPTSSASPTATPTASPSPTQTATETLTSTATVPPPPTRTPAPVLTATPKLLVRPGTYPQANACASYRVTLTFGGGYDFIIHWCVTSVVVRESMEMEFNVIWSAEILSGDNIQKGSDKDNHNMYLVDNLGRRYDHIGTTSGAHDGGSIQRDPMVPITGSFIFPPALPGATTFAFHDDDQSAVIPFIQVGSPG